MVDTSQIQIAAIVFPIIVLITNFAINSVTDEDDKQYRIFVGGMGVLGLITAMVAAVLLFLGGFSEVQIPLAYRFLLVSVIVIFFLALGIMLHELSRGLDAEADKLYVFVGIGLFVSFAAVVMQVV
jgi:cobalamin biosynthesis protein CobD/CbiB